VDPAAELVFVARLTAVELQQARVRSGRLGGRPRKPTVEEARQAALEELVPVAVKSLRAHLGDGDPAAWRCGIRVLELFYGRGAEPALDVALPVDAEDVTTLSWQELQILARRVIGELPTWETEITATTNGVTSTVIKNGPDQ
jgi:hypothetical protein